MPCLFRLCSPTDQSTVNLHSTKQVLRRDEGRSSVWRSWRLAPRGALCTAGQLIPCCDGHGHSTECSPEALTGDRSLDRHTTEPLGDPASGEGRASVAESEREKDLITGTVKCMCPSRIVSRWPATFEPFAARG